MNYTSLVADKTTAGSIKRWINNGSIDAETVLAEAEAWIWGKLRIRPMLTVAEGSIADGSDTYDFPTDFLEPIWFGYRGLYTGEIRQLDVHQLEGQRSFDSAGSVEEGEPSRYYLRGDNPPVAQLDMASDAARTARLVYFAKPAALGSGNLENFLTRRAPRLLRCACLAFANEFMKQQSEKDYWLKLAAVEISEINVEIERELRNLDFQALAR
jgi:hypothetical protein